MAAPAFGSVGTRIGLTTSTPAFPVPASVAAGDIIVVAFFADVSTTTISAFPAGFAAAENSPRTVNAGNTGNCVLHVAWKRASGADSGTYSFTLSASVFVYGNAARYTSAVAAGNPWDSPTATGDSGNVAVNNTPDIAVTTAGPDRLLIFAGINPNGDGGTWSPPAGFAERAGGASVTNLELSDLAQAVAGSSGNRHASNTLAGPTGDWMGALIGTTVAGDNPPDTNPILAYITLETLSELIVEHQRRISSAQGGVDQPLTGNGISGSEALGSPTITLTVNANGIAGSETLGQSAVTATATIVANGITSSERLGNPLVTQIISANGIPSSEIFGNTLTEPSITTGISSAQNLGSPTITTTVTISANGITSNETLGNANAASVTSVAVNGVPGAESVGSATVTSIYTINANGITSAERLGTSVVSLTVNANGIPTNEILGSPSITQITAINAASIPSSESLGNAAVTTTYTINANGIPSSELSGNFNIAAASTVTAQGINSAEQLGQPAVTTTYTINAQGIPSNETSGNTLVAVTIPANGISTSESLGNPSISVITAINAGSISSAQNVGNASVTTTYTITANGIPSNERLGNINIAAATIITAGSITSNEQFGKPAITTGSVNVAVNGIASSEQFGRAITSLGLLASTIQAYGITSENKIGNSFIGPEIDDAVIWKAEGNVIYVADETLPTTVTIDDIVYVQDDMVDAIAGPEVV